ncbi:UDP-xylose and UDP-N-acetylglucosamine transporter [Sarcoptes scabiei]|uniref:UDP-xylose and UDP-N-acetylglucosamine transporter n=1 Tax=Sarcoptes scabiei TaxID=52283 RepID=A0A834RFU0_SARSC|nr:UDP-xylose and UDP-N-acetylglucosamine transporter [Sarcoptes scabiei]
MKMRNSSTLFKFNLMAFSTIVCFINMAFQEQVLRIVPESSNFISFVQHLFISFCGFRTNGLPFILPRKQSSIRLRYYLPLVLLNFLAILSNNLSLSFGVSIPLQMIFKSSSLIANMLLGMIIMGHRYPSFKIISVLAITFGLILCTFEEYRVKHSFKFEKIQSFTTESSSNSSWSQLIGFVCITLSLFLSAGIGIYQEFLAKKFCPCPSETLYYVHLLSMPMFFLGVSDDLRKHFEIFGSSLISTLQIFSDSQQSSLFSVKNFYQKCLQVHNQDPTKFLWLWLALIVASQYCCIRSVYHLTTICSSLSVTLCVTNRKFLSLLFSILYFGNLFTFWHWLGSTIVFISIICFYSIDDSRRSQSISRQKSD